MATGEKAPDAFRTIGELSAELGVAQHILRYWETKFPQLRPLQRAGNRRYYRAADVELARRIHRLLNEEGYTVKGVQKLLRAKASGAEPEPQPQPQQEPQQEPSSAGLVTSSLRSSKRPVLARPSEVDVERRPGVDVERLKAIRNRLAAALAD